MHDHESGGAEHAGQAEDFARMNQKSIGGALGKQLVALNPTSGVEK
jgi:hypothetical protein